MTTPAGQSVGVDDIALWYHTMELPPGVVTPGWFDLRGLVDHLPWPPVHGRRCLDVGTYDGHLAFEMERRGAAEVLATDIRDHGDWDWLPRERATGPDELADRAGEKGRGFEVARAALDSRVRRRLVNVYELSPETVGTFDVVVVGSLLEHLREPQRALAAVRSVCDGALLSLEEVDLATSLLHPARPLTRLVGSRGRWAHANVAGHARMLEIAGFDVGAQHRCHLPLGPGHPASGREPASLRNRLRRVAQRLVFGGATGLPMSAARARPVV